MNERKYQRNREILRLREQGLSIRAIASQLACAKSTVSHVLAHADEFKELPPTLSIGFDADPEKIARQIHLLFGGTFTKKLGDFLRSEVPLTTPEIIERIRANTNTRQRYGIAAILAGDRYLIY